MSENHAPVILFAAEKARRRPPRGCTCREDYECYSHRVAHAADLLRVLPDELDGDAFVWRSEVSRKAGAVLALLDQITAETLGDPYDVRTEL